MADPIIKTTELVKKFGTQTVLSGVNLEVEQGETMVVMGGSGCGKSTILRMMVGSFPPTSGKVEIFGNDVNEMDEDALNETRKKFGILFQSGALFNSMTIADNVSLPLHEHTDLDSTIIDIQVKIKLELVGLREHANKYPSQISGGMKKRAGLVRALALDPKILFYDEPSAGLDPVTSAEIDQLMLDLTKKLGVTSVVVTHEMDSAFTIADRMCMLDKGRVLRVGTREEFDQLRQKGEEEAASLSEDDRLIRQFLRGDANGPLTQRKIETSYEEDLLGEPPSGVVKTPAIEPTRKRASGA
ncbi:MAG: ABC transporter ATP-binding protein [Planctomycetota bacterium]|nr:ABC transporter ATP-binding protein [Planctomycetota bacterium]